MGLILGEECFYCGGYQTTQGGKATGYCARGHPFHAAVYVVYGNYVGQEAEHWADFLSEEEANDYYDEQVAAARADGYTLDLGIARQKR